MLNAPAPAAQLVPCVVYIILQQLSNVWFLAGQADGVWIWEPVPYLRWWKATGRKFQEALHISTTLLVSSTSPLPERARTPIFYSVELMSLDLLVASFYEVTHFWTTGVVHRLGSIEWVRPWCGIAV